MRSGHAKHRPAPVARGARNEARRWLAGDFGGRMSPSGAAADGNPRLAIADLRVDLLLNADHLAGDTIDRRIAEIFSDERTA